MRTKLFYKLAYVQDRLPGPLWVILSEIRYRWLWVDEDHKDDWL